MAEYLLDKYLLICSINNLLQKSKFVLKGKKDVHHSKNTLTKRGADDRIM